MKSRRRRKIEPIWYGTKDGDKTCLALYERHYSKRRYRDGRKRTQFVGPGEPIVLRTASGDALFVWRKFIDDCIDQRTGERQEGINCAVFRNESRHLSSDLIRQADAIADFCWPGERHYTYVDTKEVRSSNPGFCFIRAEWVRCGFTKGGLLILERPGMNEIEPKDIRCELWREYDFGGRVYRISEPQKVYIGNTTHRVVDALGTVHCCPAPGQSGCVLRWEPRDLSKPVQF